MSDDNNNDPWEAYEREQQEEERRVDAAIKQIVDSYKTLCDLRGEKWALEGLQWFVDQHRPRRRKGTRTGGRARNPAYDEARREYEAAVPNRKGHVVLSRYAAKFGIDENSVLHRIQELQRQDREVVDAIKAWRERPRATAP